MLRKSIFVSHPLALGLAVYCAFVPSDAPADPVHLWEKVEIALDATNAYVRWGSSPRGAQTLALAGKVRALLDGRFNVSFEDIRRVYVPAMRHRMLMNFEAQAEGITSDTVLLKILEKVPEKGEA